MINTKISWFNCFLHNLKSADRNEKQNTALKLYCQYSHPSAQKLVSSSNNVNVEKNESMSMISDVCDNCEIF